VTCAVRIICAAEKGGHARCCDYQRRQRLHTLFAKAICQGEQDASMSDDDSFKEDSLIRMIKSNKSRGSGTRTIQDIYKEREAPPAARSSPREPAPNKKPQSKLEEFRHNVADLRKSEEDEYLEASSSDDEEEAPWMQGSVIRTDAAPPTTAPPQDQDNDEDMHEESLIDSGTFIKADTVIRSNDPKAEQSQINAAEAEDQEKPIEKYGILGGCVRDTHIKHGILYFSNIIYLFAWWIQSLRWKANDCTDYSFDEDGCSQFFGNSVGGALTVWIVMFGLFLAEFFCSSTGKYLRNINDTEGKLQHVEQKISC